MFPTYDEFEKMAESAERVTLYREIGADMETPVSILSRLLGRERAILLESARGDKTYSRFSYLAFDLDRKFILTRRGFFQDCPSGEELTDLEAELSLACAPGGGDFGDFRGGYVGHLNYEFVEACDILRRPLEKGNTVLGVFYEVKKWVVYDNYTNKAYLGLSGRLDRDNPLRAQYEAMALELASMERDLSGFSGSAHLNGAPAITRMIPRQEFMDRVTRVKEMIGEGEAIQVVLSDYLDVDGLDPFEFYRRLRRINPSPYMYFLKDGDSFIVGSSPEVHIKITDGKAMLKPIAGTRPRRDGDDLEAVIADLSRDEKEKAEHLMLVDLARNDLSRICGTGTVHVESFMEPEIYSHVIHLVSLVKGDLRKDVGILDAIRKTFPAGTVSGAPKTRAIEIIDETEQEARGAYAGCIGYLGFNGNVDMAITIRTACFSEGKARLRAGAGIVYDSVPEREYEEVINKLGALTRSGGVYDCIDR